MTALTDLAPTSPTGTARFAARSLTDDDWDAAKRLDAAAFGYVPDDDYLDTVSRPLYDLARFTGIHDPDLDHLLVGIGGIQTRQMTFPGLGPAPVAAVTWVAVRPDQQRRGILREVMTHQLHTLLHDGGGESVAILTASEGGIYGRFGYGMSTQRASLQISAPTALRPGLAVDPVREQELTEALPFMKELHHRIRAQRTGFLDRDDLIWNQQFSQHPFVQRSRGPRRIATHPDGYVSYRLAESWTDRGPDHTLTVGELCAATPRARASLWRHVLNYPLVRKVVAPMSWVEEPLPELLPNPRVVQVEIGDHVWVRLVDLPAAVQLRNYSSTASVRVQVVDEFCPWNDGTWQLDLGAGGGSAIRTDQAAELRADVADLGAAFLGGTRLGRLALAGRVTGDAAAIQTLDAALATPLRPCTPEGF